MVIETTNLCSMFGLLDKVYFSLGKPNVKIWIPDVKEEFSVKSLYNVLIDNSSVSYGWLRFWDRYIPPRVLVFRWLAMRGRILTMDNLRRRNHFIVNGCPMCLRDKETVNHLLIHCNFPYNVCVALFARFDMQWVIP